MMSGLYSLPDPFGTERVHAQSGTDLVGIQVSLRIGGAAPAIVLWVDGTRGHSSVTQVSIVRTAILFILCSMIASPLFASTWYVRPDGGTRYSTKMPNGQCDGTADTAYPGSGTNRHCAFNDVRFLFQDGSYADSTSFPAWGWIGKGGDTYLLRGSIAQGVSYRVGWNNAKSAYDESKKTFYGIAGNPYASGMPPPPSGTPAQHTRIVGENFASCHAASAKTQLHGGYAVGSVLSMKGASYVDVACLDITDFTACGRATQVNGCNSNPGILSDFAGSGIEWSNKSTNDTLEDLHIHGLAGSGMYGPTGDGVVMRYVDLLGNAGSGWNADAGDGTTGSGSLRVEHYNISWNGCAEEYPIKDSVPYGDCTDDNGGGYGDGFGTATVESHPAWNVTFDQGMVSYNTQDGLDALHIYGAGSSMTVTHTLAFGNMGQQIKVGGAQGIVTDNQIVTSCNAMRQDIPGTPKGYNAKLSDFCRAADAGVVISVNDASTTKFESNVIYSASATAIEVECAEKTCTSRSKIDFRNNITIGFRNDSAHGYLKGGRDEYANPIYVGTESNPFRNPGGVYTGNTTFHAPSNWKCPASGEQNAHCGDPHLVDETWHNYGYGDMSPAKGGASLTEKEEPESGVHGLSQLAVPNTHLRIRTVAALCGGAGVLGVAAWRGLRYRENAGER